jgi:hypothetical protein
MRATIIDEFTDLPVSHQRKTQLRWEKVGRCTICGRPSKKGRKRCASHLRKTGEQTRRYRDTHPGYWRSWASKSKRR